MDKILEIKNLVIDFESKESTFRAVNNISLAIEKGKTLSLVGESGSGKSVTALSVLQLLPEGTVRYSKDSSIEFEKTEIINSSKKDITSLRGNKISMIFQEPMTSLNPYQKVGYQIDESLIIHRGLSKKEARERTLDLLKKVKIPEPEVKVNSFPHQLSGGQRQRIMIAMALANEPDLLIADEPTTALDVTVETALLELLSDLQKEFGMSILFITHDLNIVKKFSDDVCVMKDGEIVEAGKVKELFDNPKHPYTKALLSSIPSIDPEKKSKAIELEGEIPSAMNPPSGCVFRTRCPHASTDGKEGNIEMSLVEVKPGHWLDKCGVNCGKYE